MEPTDSLDALRAFRDSLYECFERRSDALFELTDALLTTAGVVPSPVHLSLQPLHRRGWGSLYAALSRGRIDAEALRKAVASYPLEEDRAPVYAVDVLASGVAVTRKAARSAATTTIPLATRRVSP